AAVVDDFIDRLMDDARLNANPKVDEAHHRVSRSGFKYLVTEQVCWAAGGPQKYSGRSMRDSHEHLAITPGQWEALLDDFRQTLDKFGVPEHERRELFAIVESTRGDIVAGQRLFFFIFNPRLSFFRFLLPRLHVVTFSGLPFTSPASDPGGAVRRCRLCGQWPPVIC